MNAAEDLKMDKIALQKLVQNRFNALFALILGGMVLSLLPACGSQTYQGESDSQSVVGAFSTAALIQEAATGSHRSAANIERNRYRNPVETLTFFGLQPDMTVIEISPGGLWYGEILAPVLKNTGRYIAAGYDLDVPDQPEYRYRATNAMLARFERQPDIFGSAESVPFSPPSSLNLGSPNSADMVVTFRNSHGWVRDNAAEDVYKAMFKVLKPGGVLGVVQHRGPRLLENGKISGYLPEATVIATAERAGFVLDARSEINANAADTKNYSYGVWTLPPSLRLKDTDREKYLAIGESDRMTLRFRKPK